MLCIQNQQYVCTHANQDQVCEQAELAGLDRYDLILSKGRIHIAPRDGNMYTQKEIKALLKALTALSNDNGGHIKSMPLDQCHMLIHDTGRGEQYGIFIQHGSYRQILETVSPASVINIDPDDEDVINPIDNRALFNQMIKKYSGRRCNIYIDKSHNLWLAITLLGRLSLHESNDMQMMMLSHAWHGWVYTDDMHLNFPMGECADIIGRRLCIMDNKTYTIVKNSQLWYYVKCHVHGDPRMDLMRDGYATYMEVPIEK